MNIKRPLFVGLLSFSLFASCQILDPIEEPVTFLQIQPFTISDSLSGKQSLADVSSVFVYFNNEPLGTYLLPAQVPLMGDKAGSLLLLPGITRNGISAYQSIYPPYYAHSLPNFQPVPDATITVNPITGFRENLNPNIFVFEENFETSSQFLSVNGDTAFTRKKITDCNYCNQGSGVFNLSAQNTTSEIISSTFFKKENKATFLEFNYRNSSEFSVGLAMLDGAGAVYDYYLVTFKARQDWNKAYIPLNEAMALNNNIQKVYLLFKTSLPSGQNSGTVELDNIRVLAF